MDWLVLATGVMKRLLPILAALLLVLGGPAAQGSGGSPSIQWQEWSEEVFERARREGRLVLLDLEAVWCHRCHVMDQDARPELSNRYQDYGWPATVIFDGDGTELIKRRGYIRPQWMQWLLEAVAQDPSAAAHETEQLTVTPAPEGRLSGERRALLEDKIRGGIRRRLRELGPHPQVHPRGHHGVCSRTRQGRQPSA